MNNPELADKLQDAASNHYGNLCGMLWDAGAALRKLHTENMALRCTEMALRDVNAELERQLELGKYVVRGDVKLLAERDMAIAELESQLEEARKDAERYRWLRSQHEIDDEKASHYNYGKTYPERTFCVFGDDGEDGLDPITCDPGALDAAIDAAMQKGQS